MMPSRSSLVLTTQVIYVAIVEIYENINIEQSKAYRNDPKFLDGLIWAKSADPDQTAPPIRLLLEEQSDQGLHCLLFHLHLFDEIP